MDFIDLKSQQLRIRKMIENRMNTVLDHGQYIMGPEVAELEARLIQYTGAQHCISNSNGTDALLLALMALGTGPGDEVITTPLSFFATAEAISFLGAKPVFVDIDPNTYNLDPALIEARITPKTKAIIPVSLYGQCADHDAIDKVAQKYQLAVIEDAAQSFGATYKGRKSCNLSTISCTSFFPSKPLGGYGDGGACFTNDAQIAEKLRVLRTHGQPKRYVHTEIGMNGRLDTLQAAILLAKLEIFDDEVSLRQKIGARYTQLLEGVVKVQHIAAECTSVYAQYTIEVNNRADFIQKMTSAGIPTAVHYPVPLHLQPVYQGQYQAEEYKKSEKVAEHVVSLPMHPYLDEKTQDKIVSAVRDAVR